MGFFQVDYTATNSYNIDHNVTPPVTLGAGNTAVQGIDNIPGLVSQNDTLARNILTGLRGSVASIAEGFGVAIGM